MLCELLFQYHFSLYIHACQFHLCADHFVPLVVCKYTLRAHLPCRTSIGSLLQPPALHPATSALHHRCKFSFQTTSMPSWVRAGLSVNGVRAGVVGGGNGVRAAMAVNGVRAGVVGGGNGENQNQNLWEESGDNFFLLFLHALFMCTGT